MPLSHLAYTGGQLDRADALRKDPAWIAAQRARPDARLVPLAGDKNLLIRAADGSVAPALVPMSALQDTDADDWTFLGLAGETPLFAAELGDPDAERVVLGIPGAEYADLRRVGPQLSMPEASLLAYARAMIIWHRRNRHCGVCGHLTRATNGGHARRCTDPACETESYPRTDPAVIMLVERPASDGDPARALLANHARFPQQRAFSTLAGFVEPGESLEEAVAREVLEETGVRVGRVTYEGSQPWPFPSSLMIGFRAEALTTDLTLDPAEITEARWFTAAELRDFGEWGDESDRFKLPRRDSIARRLVEGWMEAEGLRV